MTMMEEVFQKLRALQDVLSRKILTEKELEEIPHGLATQEELLNRLKKTFNDRSTEFQDASARIRDLKQKLFEAETSREHAEKQMDGISTQREYEALDKEIRDASEKEQQVRKDLQREERNIQELEEAVTRDEQMIKQIEADVSEKRAFIESKSNEKRSELKKLSAEEDGIIPGLDSETVFKFERIIRSKQGLGIVPVKNGVCSGCHMILPAQFVNEVREGNRIIFCPYCSRILFYQETEEGEESYLVDIESGGLADLDDFEDEEEDGDFDEGDEEEPEKESMGFEEE
jgi:predicted  nucleic acid-binding Zn-ribbon protein